MSLLAQHTVWRDSSYAPFATVLVILVLLIVSHWTLTWDVSARGRWCRRVLLVTTIYFIVDFTFNPQYTLGNPIRDLSFGSFGWHFLARALDVGLVFDVEERQCPRWIIPDWDREELDRGIRNIEGESTSSSCDGSDDMNNNCSAVDKTVFRSRPQWAQERKIIPRYWSVMPFPRQPLEKLLWSLDVLLSRRTGTCVIFPKQMRALEWDKKKLEKAGNVQYEQSNQGGHPIWLQADVQPFGYVEQTPIHLLSDIALVCWAYQYMNSIDLPGHSTSEFYQRLPFSTQICLTLCTGTFIALVSGPIEAVFFPLLVGWLHLPPTLLPPSFRDVARSQSLSELWSWRWHAYVRRDFLRLGSLVTLGAQENRIFAVLKVFFLSGVMHSMVLIHSTSSPSWGHPSLRLIHSFINPGVMSFFLMQGVLTLLEAFVGTRLRATIAPQSSWRKHMFWLLRLVWVWGTLLLTARWFVAELYAAGCFSKTSIDGMHFNSFLLDVRNWVFS